MNSGIIEGSLIMTRALAIFLLPFFLAACGGGGNPFDPGETAADSDTDTGGTADPDADPDDEVIEGTLVPAVFANDIESATYDASTETLTINGLTLDDATAEGISYRRRPDMDISNADGDVVFEAYTVQDDPLDRHVTAYAGEGLNGGDVRAVVGHSGGPRNRFFSGAFFERDGEYDPADIPDSAGSAEGNTRYVGSYVGLTNVAGSEEDLLRVPDSVDPDVPRPTQAAEITGEVVMVADFEEGAIEGDVLKRRLVDTGDSLANLVLVNSEITQDGSFSGSVEYQNEPEASIGDYGGVIGGSEAGSIAGALNLSEFDGPNGNNLGFENERELGIFILDRCGQDADDPLCATLSP